MLNPNSNDHSAETRSIDRWRFSLRPLLFLSMPVALFVLTVGRLVANMSDLHLRSQDIAMSVGLGAVVGTIVASGFWLARRRRLGMFLGIVVWSIAILVYMELGLGIPAVWIIE
jgi:hypothetical protein